MPGLCRPRKCCRPGAKRFQRRRRASAMITYGLRNPCAALVLLLCGLTDSYAYDASISEAYTSVSLPLPSTKMVVVCHGFGCTYRTAIGLSGGDRAKLAELLATSHIGRCRAPRRGHRNRL